MKKLYVLLLMFACAVGVRAEQVANVCTVTGTMDFSDVKGCQIDVNSFGGTSEVTFALFTEEGWYYEDGGNLVNPGGYGFIYLVRITPSSLEDLSGDYTLNSNTRMLEYVNNKLTAYPITAGHAYVMKATGKNTYSMNLSFSLSTGDYFQGVIIGIADPLRQGIENTNANANANAPKIIRDGQLYIIRGDKTFNALGIEVK